MFQLIFTNKFNKDVKRGYNIDLLKNAIRILEEIGSLPSEYNTHKLVGNYIGYYEAHLKPDWLIIWKLITKENQIWLTRTGSHSDLFKN